jgi:hypothetical protein
MSDKWKIKKPMPAKQLMDWPGREPAALCDEHRNWCIGMAAIIGFMPTWTPCEETICENCESQFKYLTPEERVEAIASVS